MTLEYEIIIGRDTKAGVWVLKITNIPGLRLEDPSFDNLLEKLHDSLPWLVGKPQKSSVQVRLENRIISGEWDQDGWREPAPASPY